MEYGYLYTRNITHWLSYYKKYICISRVLYRHGKYKGSQYSRYIDKTTTILHCKVETFSSLWWKMYKERERDLDQKDDPRK